MRRSSLPAGSLTPEKSVSRNVSSNDSIKVYIRCRPLRENETHSAWKIHENQLSEQSEHAFEPFTFDKVYDSDAKTEHIFNEQLNQLTDGVIAGFNASFFCYGQTGSGKTHTMIGTEGDPGALPMMVKKLCESCAASTTCRYQLRASYCEIYNE
eukprot:gene29396-36608_t